MELDKIQKEIVESKEKNIIVVAGSGSGKTRVLTERIRYLIEHEKVDPKNIVAITFTNAAAEQMRERLGSISKDCFIGTIHSYANNLLLIGGYDTTSFIDSKKFDMFFKEISRHPEVIREVEYLLIDEFQDIDEAQYKFFKMIQPNNFFVVGDDWQNIYEWRGSDSEFFFELMDDDSFKIYEMGNNYRTGENIIRFAMQFLRTLSRKTNKRIACKNPNKGILVEIENDYEYIIKEIEKDKKWGSWFILARTNAQIELMMARLKNRKIPCDTFKKSEITVEELNTKMNEDTVKILTVHAAKGLENDNVVVIGVHPDSRKDEEKRVAYVAATRARNRLIWCYERMSSWKKKELETFDWE